MTVAKIHQRFAAWLGRLHEDQRGSISIVTVFTMMLLATVLGMIINIGRHADRKVKMQNAADSSAYSGGIVLARGMNTIGFTNRLLCDVFAMTAFMREARDRNAQAMTEPILAAWEQLGPIFGRAEFQKFSQMDGPLSQQVALERDLVSAFSDHYAAVSDQTLPVMETILAEELIPQFQHTLLQTVPELAQEAADEIARQHGDLGGALSNDTDMRSVLWRTDVTPVGGVNETITPSLPVVDPVRDTSEFQLWYERQSRGRRNTVSRSYLSQLNGLRVTPYFSEAPKSQFLTLWRSFTCGQLSRLLNDEYPDRNLPFVLRYSPTERFDLTQHLNDRYMFVGVAYWQQMDEHLPGLFENPKDYDDATFAQVSIFLPRPRLVKGRPPPDYIERVARWGIREWSLWHQDWTVSLVPAASPAIPDILQETPPGTDTRPQQFGALSDSGFRKLNTH